MISVTKLLLAKEYQGDELRYRKGAAPRRAQRFRPAGGSRILIQKSERGTMQCLKRS